MSLDRSLPVPLRVQLRGLIQYGIACGELAPGACLPSVRHMAGDVGVAPMTVAQVYRDLKTDGLLETRAGSATFVARRSVRSRVLVVSWLPEFLAFMEAGVQRFAPHVGSIAASPLDDAAIDALVIETDVVVLSTGSETLRDRLPPGVVSLDYAHMPDPGELERVVRPLLRRVRSDVPATPAPNRKVS